MNIQRLCDFFNMCFLKNMLTMRHFLILSSIFLAYGSTEESSRIVNTLQGPVRGYKQPGWDLFQFYGIPYATVPTGANRFKGPLDPPSWTETFEAVERNIICPQHYSYNSNVLDAKMREDCLVTTIYVPDTNKTNLPVLAFVHGGLFQSGYADKNTSRNLVQDKEVIVAMFNYRLGVHGFLCLGTQAAPGNAGMKDQVAFLRWLQKNIAYFGGNPNDVTVHGTSAGGRAVDLLSLSKTTKGLFKGVVADSGISLSAGSVQVEPLENAREFAKLLNFNDVDDLRSLEQFYLNASFDLLTSINTKRLKKVLFAPCVERNIGEETFLEESPFRILSKGGFDIMPMLYGFTEFDGAFRIDLFDEWKHAMNEDITDFIPVDLHFPSKEVKQAVVQQVRSFYFGDKEINNESIISYLNFFTDSMYVYPILRSVSLRLKSGHDQFYLYEFSFISKETLIIPHVNVQGAFHVEQTNVIFDHGDETSISTELRAMKWIMREMWYNFYKYGKPVPEQYANIPNWPTMTLHDSLIMSINQTLEMKPLHHRAMFWDDLYQKYYKEPSPPSL